MESPLVVDGYVDVDGDGSKLYYRITGEGETTLVWMHGLPLNGDQWSGQVDHFASKSCRNVTLGVSIGDAATLLYDDALPFNIESSSIMYEFGVVSARRALFMLPSMCDEYSGRRGLRAELLLQQQQTTISSSSNSIPPPAAAMTIIHVVESTSSN